MWSTFFPFSLAAGLFIQPHTICQQHLPSCTWQSTGLNHCSPLAVLLCKITALTNVRQRQCLNSERAWLCFSLPQLSDRAGDLASFEQQDDCHMLCPCCPRSWLLLQLPGQELRAVSPAPLGLFCHRAESSPLLPCDTVMGCDMLFVGLVLVFCSPLTQQARPLQRRVAQSPFISALLFALPGERRRHLETDTGGTTSAKYPP